VSDKTTWTVNFEYDTLTDGRGVVVAKDPGLPGCMADGANEREALENLNSARADYLATQVEDLLVLLGGLLDVLDNYDLCLECGQRIYGEPENHSADCPVALVYKWLDRTVPKEDE
jgi:predicted RNase H-like HicB family nuclease